MKELTLKNFIIKNVLIWWIGWLSLGLVEAGLRRILNVSPLTMITFITLLVYSLVGIILGLLFGIITFLIGRVTWRLKGLYGQIHFSMAFCIFTIVLLYTVLFFVKNMPYFSQPYIIFKGILYVAFSLFWLFFLPFFFQWMDQKRRLFASYLSLLPSLWIVTSLKSFWDNGLLPPILPIHTYLFIFPLIPVLIICFFLVYFFIFVINRFLKRWSGTPLLKFSLIGLPLLCFLMVIVLFVRKEDHKGIKRVIKNAPINKPNIILVTMDTVRGDHVSCYGYKRTTTPNLDRFSQEGMLYKNAYSTDSWTVPSHASIFTGKYPSKHGAHDHSEIVIKYLNESQKVEKLFAST